MDPETTLKELINAIEEGDKEKLKEKINLFHQDLNRNKQILYATTQNDLILAACRNKQADILHYLLNETDILGQLAGPDYNDTEVIRQRTEAFKHALIWDDFSMVEMLYDYWSGDLHWIGHDVNDFIHIPKILEMLGNVLKDARVVCVVETQQLLLDVHSLSVFNSFQRELYSSISKTTSGDTASMILEMLRIYDEYSKIENVRLPNEDVVQEKELQDNLNDKTSEYMSIQAYISYEFYYRKLDFNVALLILDNTFVLRKDLKERFNKPKNFFKDGGTKKKRNKTYDNYQAAVSLYKNVECALYHFIYCTCEDWRLYLPRDRKIVKKEEHGSHNGRIIFPIIITFDEHKLYNGPILFLERKNFKKCVNDLKDLLHLHIKSVDPETQTKVGKTSENKEKIDVLLDDNYLTPTMHMSDYYSLSKIVYYIKAIENTHDINVLMIERILQVTGEMLKSTKKSCHLLESTQKMLQIPVDTIKYLSKIRLFLSKVDEGQLSTRIDIANNQAQVFHDIKKDLKIIEQMTNSVLDVYKHILDKALLKKGLALLDEQIKNMPISLHIDKIDECYKTHGENLIESESCEPLLQELSDDTGLTVQLLKEFFWISYNKDLISPKIELADTRIGDQNARTTTFCKNLAENNTFGGIKELHEIFEQEKQLFPPRDKLISCLISRVNRLKIILKDPQVKLKEYLRTYKHDKTFRFELEMIVADIANVLAHCIKTPHLPYQPKKITKKFDKLLRDIDLGNLLDHGNPFIDVIADALDSYDISTALLLKAIMFAEDAESIEALLKLFQSNIHYDTIKNGNLADMNDDQKTLYEVFTKSSNWKDYVELVAL